MAFGPEGGTPREKNAMTPFHQLNSRMQLVSRVIPLLIVGLVCWHCGGVPPTYFYRVDQNLDKDPSNGTDVLPVSIAVAPFKSDILYESDKIVYRSSLYEVQFYHYRRWIAPPRKLVTEELYKHYRRSGAFKQVVRLPSTQAVDYVLTGQIQSFEEWDEKEAWYGLVALEFQLQDPETKETLWESVISERSLAEKKDPVSVVRAINASLNAVLSKSISELKNHLRKER
ncbi:ABC-type transport auxiliary lipoprotein family protein [bacterium]|nr:ABC-type transport auxiliary lipoprotein family protein [bacterium]